MSESWRVIHADALETLRKANDAGIDAICTDPPYELNFMGKGWDNAGIAYSVEFWAECLRVLKPGGHLLAFGATRTYHRMACAIEDAGFEIRDSIHWVYGSGFPKSLDVSKAIDKANGRRFEDRYALGRHIRERREAAGLTRADVNAWFGYRDGCEHWERQDPSGARVPTLADWRVLQARLGLSEEYRALVERVEAEREVTGSGVSGKTANMGGLRGVETSTGQYDITAPATDEAKQWDGWGTALKPSHEPIVVARKPLAGTVAANVLQYGTGAINVDGCRVATSAEDAKAMERANTPGSGRMRAGGSPIGTFERSSATGAMDTTKGRWPTNLVLGEPAAEEMGEESRFFPVFKYQAKAPKKERPVVTTEDGRKINHPTVKPVALMRWLVRLVTPPGGVVLDPFAGTGTTLEAAHLEGFRSVGIELDADSVLLIEERMRKYVEDVA